MSDYLQPSASEVLDALDELQRDPLLRTALNGSYEIYQALVAVGTLRSDGLDWLATRMQELHGDGLIAYGTTQMGVSEPPVWDDGWIQCLSNWRVTAAGRSEARAYRSDVAATKEMKSEVVEPPARAEYEVFLSHASEDKVDVVRPLVAALSARGLRTWVDELELTMGDSLDGRINNGLARSRFGVVVLSRAFFAKTWPMRELAGLAAREVAGQDKVILPVWHGIDEQFLAAEYPTLADRLGASTARGIDYVADEIVRAHDKTRAPNSLERKQVVAVPAPAEVKGVPSDSAGRDTLVVMKPSLWEYRLFASYLRSGIAANQLKWHDHELRLARGPRRVLDKFTASTVLGEDCKWLAREIRTFNLILDPEVQELAFGPPGAHGDHVRIEHLATRLATTYEGLLDWSASVRNTLAPGAFQAVNDSIAELPDPSVIEFRSFVDRFAAVLDQASELLAADSRRTEPIELSLDLTLSVDQDALRAIELGLEKAELELLEL